MGPIHTLYARPPRHRRRPDEPNWFGDGDDDFDDKRPNEDWPSDLHLIVFMALGALAAIGGLWFALG